MDWSGTTLTVNFTNVTSERETQVMRNTWEYTSDFNTVTLTTERFSDGRWWTTRKVKGTKVE